MVVTTIEIPQQLLKQLKILAIERNTKLKEVIKKALMEEVNR